MSDRTKIVNDYGKCEVEEGKVEIGQIIEWQGNIKVVPNMQLLEISETEYHNAFPEGVSFAEFQYKLDNNELDLVDLIGKEEAEMMIENSVFINSIVNEGNKHIKLNTMEYTVDPDYGYNEFNTKFEFDAQCEDDYLEWEDLSEYTREKIISPILRGEKQGEYEEIIYEDNYYILYPGNGMFASIETFGTIDELMEEYDDGEIQNIGSFMAALDYAGEDMLLDKVIEKETRTIDGLIKKAETRVKNGPDETNKDQEREER